ncbi:MAG TPA: CPBP family intramembrane glutamic endopeptidase, partial [Stellaceae bacterium]|nr:CPBP family intramembrane glutamic endopeptidase [Stellaceae bacterium]
VSEELIFRGVLFRIVEEGCGTLAALAVSAAVFGGLHAWNPGASIASGTAIALEAGILFGLAYAGSRTLWLPIGLHFGWNFAEGGIFGGAISGFPAEGLLDVKLSGPDILTGGAFGPEASLVTLAVCLATSLILLLAIVRHGQWRGVRLSLRHPGGD